MRTSIALLFLAAVLWADDPQVTWIEKLSAPDAAVRERAERALLRQGTPALAALRAKAETTSDADTQARITKLIAEIEKREPQGLRFFVGLPKMKLTVDTELSFNITVENRSSANVVLYPYLSLRVLNSDGSEAKRSRKLGRSGLRLHDHPLGGVKFITLKPGEKWTVREKLKQYMHDPKWITGWKLAAPGTYTLEFTYAYDRKQANGLNDKEHPAHKAVAMKHTFQQKLKLEP